MGLLQTCLIFAVINAIACLPSQLRYSATTSTHTMSKTGKISIDGDSDVNALISYQAQNDQGYYKFGYGVADGSYRVEEGSPLDGVLGTYGYIDTRGQEVKVYYKADHRGFQILTSDEYRRLRSIKTGELATEIAPDSKKHETSTVKPIEQNSKPARPTSTTPTPTSPFAVPVQFPGTEYNSDPGGEFYDYSNIGDEQYHVDDPTRQFSSEFGVEIANQYGGQPHSEISVQRWPLLRTLAPIQPFPVYYFPTIQQYHALGHHYRAPHLYPLVSKGGHQTRFLIRS